MARQRDSPKAFIIECCTFQYAEIHVTEEFQCGIPHVVRVIFVVVRVASGKEQAGIEEAVESSFAMPVPALGKGAR